MVNENRKLPLGIQDFSQIISDHYLLVDKTELVYKLVHTGKSYFLSRPRRFGKSVLLSTIKAYWEGKQNLFQGLKIVELEKDNKEAWKPRPVFYLDFNRDNYEEETALEGILDAHLKVWERAYCVVPVKGQTLAIRFQNVLQSAAEQTGTRCVILVDEYDKPLLEAMENKELLAHNKAVFKGFFSTLKSFDEYIQFVFITGVTKFSKVSIFSDLNQLRDISMSRDYAEICGITEEEMTRIFMPEIKALAEEQEYTEEECLAKLKNTYDGYHFHEKGKGVYNPFSLLTALADRKIGSYWFATGTPTFLVRRLRTIGFDLRKFTDGTLYANERMLMDYQEDNPDPISLLYQTGYLTIVDYEKRTAAYTLAFPNDEVKYGFLESLLPAYVEGVGAGSGKDILTLTKYIENGDLDNVKAVFTALFASIPYPTSDAPFEHDFQTVFYIALTLLGQFVKCEAHTSMGRVDCILESKNFIYIFEFKRDESAANALQQIKEKHYADPYASDPRKMYMIGVSFDSATRQLNGWKVEER